MINQDEEIVYSDWMKQYENDKRSGRINIIDNYENFDRKTMTGSQGGLFSKDFGPTLDIDQPMREFSCFCGQTNGKYKRGTKCHYCNETVKQQFGANILRSGWIELNEFYVLVPAAYAMVERIIGKTALINIIAYKIDISLDGQVKSSTQTNKSPYNNIGLMEFKRRFTEIILFYAALRNQKKRADILLSQKDRIFTNVINVVAPEQRPAFISKSNRDNKSKQLHFDEINRVYTTIISKASILKKRSSSKNISTLSVLYSIQEELQNLYECIIKTKLSGKKKLLQGSLVGTRMSFSSRMVIISHTNDKSKMDGIGMSYKAFIGLYKLEIINCLKRGYGPAYFMNYTIWEILDYINNAIASNKLDITIYSIIQLLMNHKKGGLYCLINRNPTIDIGSIQCARIVEVEPDPENYTMALFLSILSPFAADFDGDILNCFSLKEKCIVEAFNTAFNSRFLTMDRTGEDEWFNSGFGPYHDILTNLLSLESETL